VLRRGPNPVSVRSLSEDSLNDTIFIQYCLALKRVNLSLIYDNLTSITLVYVHDKRAGCLIVKWYNRPAFVEGVIRLFHITKPFSKTKPHRIILADIKDHCRRSQSVVSLPFRLRTKLLIDDLDSREIFEAAGFMEISRNDRSCVLVWPNDKESR